MAASKEESSVKLQAVERYYKQRLDNAFERLSKFEQNQPELTEILQTYNDQMAKLESQNEKNAKMVREMAQLQFSHLRLSIEDFLENVDMPEIDKKVRMLDYNFKKMQGVV